jgi:L-iditol 2-dehydrogenase
MAGVPQNMRAVFFPTQRTMEVREVPVKQPGAGEVLLRVRFCGICGSDVSVYKGGALAGPDVVLGHEISAEVVYDPGGEWQPGSRVAVFPPTGCGDCIWCREQQPRYCLDPTMQKRWGGYAEYTVYPSENLIPIPDQIDDQTATLGDPLGVGVRAVAVADPKPGSTAYVAGLGAIGLCTVSALAAAGCRVVGADVREDRRELGLEIGCEKVIDPGAEDAYQVGLDLDPHGFRCAFEASGAPAALQEIWDACGHGGTVGILGIPTMPVLLLRMTVREQLAFSIAGPTWDSMADALVHLHRHPEITRMITDTVPLEAVPETMAALADGKGGIKVLVDPRSSG